MRQQRAALVALLVCSLVQAEQANELSQVWEPVVGSNELRRASADTVFEATPREGSAAVTACASADASYSGGVAIFTQAKGGLMYEASVGGQKFKVEARE